MANNVLQTLLVLACVAAGPRTRLNPLYSPLYTEGLERLRRRLAGFCHLNILIQNIIECV